MSLHYRYTGGPGSGKAAQCKKLADRYTGYIHISVGDLLRGGISSINQDSKWKVIAEAVRMGQLVSQVRWFICRC